MIFLFILKRPPPQVLLLLSLDRGGARLLRSTSQGGWQRRPLSPALVVLPFSTHTTVVVTSALTFVNT